MEEMLMKFMTSTVLGLTIAFAVSACNTIEGAGEDIEAGGQAVEDAAE
jgi:predicted small secreted protein